MRQILLVATRLRRRPAPGPLALLAHSLADAPSDDDEERLARARKLLQKAIARSKASPANASKGFAGVKVDKYFGTKLPPVCASLGCYVTDDGKRFYCINPACQKHLQRETKHTRRGNPKKQSFVYFRCPRCDSRSVEMRVLLNRYVCRTCRYNWAN
jgi:phage terminase large subunit GpA-like protein